MVEVTPATERAMNAALAGRLTVGHIVEMALDRPAPDHEHVEASLSMLRCSECGDLLDAYGSCSVHGLLDIEGEDE